MIKIDFEFETDHGIFRDSLWLPDDHPFTETEIENMKLSRRDNWIAAVTAPPLELDVEEIRRREEAAADLVDINGVSFYRLIGSPPPQSHVIQIDGVWYCKV